MSTTAPPSWRTATSDAADPFSAYAQLRGEHGDVWFDAEDQVWVVLGYAPAREVLRGDGWSNDPGAGALGRRRLAETGLDPEMSRRFLVFTDPPTHTRLRGALRRSFSPAAIERLRERVDEIVDQAVASVPANEPFDVMEDLARPLPISVMAEWMDLGVDGASLLWEESPALVRMLDVGVEPANLQPAAEAFTALVGHLLPLAVERRRDPGDDLLSAIAANRDLSLDEVVTSAILLAIAGHETTANLVGASVAGLVGPARPDPRLGSLREDPERAAPVVDELLRLFGPVQAMARTATHRQQVGPATISKDGSVLVVVAAANRDPGAYRHPDRFDPSRFTGEEREPPPLAFGLGRHHCLGAALARLETATLMSRLLDRQPISAGEVCWRQTRAIRGPEAVPISFTR